MSFDPEDPMLRTQQVDAMTKRLRTPNNQYTVLTNKQISNINTRPNPFFHFSKKVDFPDKRHYMDRYATNMTQYNLRGVPGTQPHCYVGDKWLNEPLQKYDSCRRGATTRWGQEKAGLATVGHHYGEPVDRFTTIDMYRRPATNRPGPIHMDYGRPIEGYYLQRFASDTTWNESSVPLNKQQILQTIQPKTRDEYKLLEEQDQMLMKTQPQYTTEYNDMYLNKTRTETFKNGLQDIKQRLAERTKEEELRKILVGEVC